MSPAATFPLTHFLLSLIASLLLLLFSSQRRLDPVSTTINRLFSPLGQPFVTLRRTLTVQSEFVRLIPHQYRLIKDLQRQNNELAILAKRAQELDQENQSLKSALQVPQLKRHALLPVKITSVSRFAIINQGSSNGVQVDFPLVKDNLFLGLVTAVTSHTAKVRLVTDPDFELAVITHRNITGILRFRQQHLELSQILQKEPLFVDDRLYSKGSPTIPDDLLVGTITQITSSASDIYQTALVKPAAAISDQQTAFIILD